jgi:hypothetical protein
MAKSGLARSVMASQQEALPALVHQHEVQKAPKLWKTLTTSRHARHHSPCCPKKCLSSSAAADYELSPPPVPHRRLGILYVHRVSERQSLALTEDGVSPSPGVKQLIVGQLS